jgi:GntR family transcriptional regulator / MocR family aminotransferase
MLHLELDGDGARYEQLTRALRYAIDFGQLRPGARLPPTRELAMQLALSRNTVLTAYEILCAEGLAHSRGGSGTFVNARSMSRPASGPVQPVAPQSRYAERSRRIPPVAPRMPSRVRYDLQYGEPLLDPVLITTWRKELAAAASRVRLHYPSAQGLRALREAICEHVARRRGVLCDSDDVIVVHGTQQAVTVLARVLVDEGDEVVVEDPRYPLITQALEAHGARLVPVPIDDEGIDCAALPSRPPRFIFVTPSHQFPGAVTMSLARRHALLDYAERHRCWIVEDDYDGEFRYDSSPVPALRSLDAGDRVAYVGTFSKVLFPALRLGYLIAPRALRDDLVVAKRLDDLGCGAIEQLAMARFMASGGFDRHLRKASAELRRRRHALLEGLAQHAPAIEVAPSAAGMHVVAWLPGWSDAQFEQLLAHALDRGVGLYRIGPHCFQPPAWPGLLLGYAGLSVTQLRAATALLGRCLSEVQA